jgi:hypothetical protein
MYMVDVKESVRRTCPRCKQSTSASRKVCEHCGAILESDETTHFKAEMYNFRRTMGLAGLGLLAVAVIIILIMMFSERNAAPAPNNGNPAATAQ